MGLGNERREEGRQPLEGGANPREQAPRRARGLRGAAPSRVEISKLCSAGLYLRRHGQRHGKDFPSTRRSRHRTPQENFNIRDEPVPEICGLRTRRRSRSPSGKDLLHDAGSRRASHIHSVHRPEGKIAFLLSAISGKPDSPRLWLRRHPDLDQEPRQRIKNYYFGINPTRSTPAPLALSITFATYWKSTSPSLCTNATRSEREAKIFVNLVSKSRQLTSSLLILSRGMESPAFKWRRITIVSSAS